MRYLAIFLLALNLTIGIWCVTIGSLGWIASLLGIAAAVYIFVMDSRSRAQTKAMYQRWADEDAALVARINRHGHGERS